MSTYVFGDLQGCFDELRRLLDLVHYAPSEDRLWFLGDVINRGPENRQTLEFVMKMPHTLLTLGNHDLHFLAVATNCQRPGKHDNLNDLLQSDRLMEMIEWLRHMPLVHHDSATGYTMAHAGLPPTWDLATCLARAAEVETVLRSDRFADFLRGMYGDEPNRWRDDLEGMDRLRLICNYFTRMRYCKADGELELRHKEHVEPEGYAPWFTLPRPKHSNLRILFGHWAALGGVTDRADVIGLDTGCVWGGRLTAMRLDDGQFFSTPCLAGGRMDRG